MPDLVRREKNGAEDRIVCGLDSPDSSFKLRCQRDSSTNAFSCDILERYMITGGGVFMSGQEVSERSHGCTDCFTV